MREPVREIKVQKIAVLRDNGREGCSTLSLLLLPFFFFFLRSVIRKVKGGKLLKTPLQVEGCRRKAEHISTFFCLAASFSLESLHLIFELWLDIFWKMCIYITHLAKKPPGL